MDRDDSIIMVAGMPSGGTSLAAGMLRHLGVDMGRIAPGVTPGPRRYRGFECLDCWEGGVRHAFDPARAAAFLESVTSYFEQRRRTATGPFGVKHNPLVWMGMFDGIEQLPVRLVSVRRPLDEVMTSDRRYRGDDVTRAARLGVSWLALQRLIERIPPSVSLSYAGILADPSRAVATLDDALGLAASAARREEAVRFVDPALRHVAV